MNVYLYCSREGVPDSVKNNKEIKRKRLSMRCDCKWRITLYQQESKLWIFRKAMNPASMVHNHPLISPDDIRQPWPQAVFDRIAFYANQRNLTTSETRERIKDDFPDLVWDERRFYNRLTEERKQIRLRDSETRVFSTMDLAARVASIASADPSLSYKVNSSLENVLVEICEQLRIDPAGASSRVVTSPPPMSSSSTCSSSSAGGGMGAIGGMAGIPGGMNQASVAGITLGGMAMSMAANSSSTSSTSSASMSVTSPTSTNPTCCPSTSSTSSSPLTSSDYVVTYPGCVISVKTAPNQKGRPSSVSSPVADASYGLGLGLSPPNDRKRSLSDDCFTRQEFGGPSPGPTPSFGAAMNTTHMMSHLDISSSGVPLPGHHHHHHPHHPQHPHQQQHNQQQQQQQQHPQQSLSGGLAGLDSTAIPGNPGLLIMSDTYHPHPHPSQQLSHQSHSHSAHPSQQQQQQHHHHQQQQHHQQHHQQHSHSLHLSQHSNHPQHSNHDPFNSAPVHMFPLDRVENA
ncbi:hypothetical protein BGZ94_006855 [Podila epigama]|nr:hypothetical protein BGZ94_006855 [Podila epigama]